MKNRKPQVNTTDSTREAILKLLDKGFDASEIADLLGSVSYTSVKRVVKAIKAARSKSPEAIKEYKDSYAYTEPNWIWAKAKFNIEGEEIETSIKTPDGSSSSEVMLMALIKQNKELLAELKLLRELLEGELKNINEALTTILDCWGADTEDRKKWMQTRKE